jgi:hypothetical protein
MPSDQPDCSEAEGAQRERGESQKPAGVDRLKENSGRAPDGWQRQAQEPRRRKEVEVALLLLAESRWPSAGRAEEFAR